MCYDVIGKKCILKRKENLELIKDFLTEKFSIVIDGSWNKTEIIAAAIAVVVVLLVILLIVKIIKGISKRVNPRKDTIFSHRKNKYKNRIGKKVKY